MKPNRIVLGCLFASFCLLSGRAAAQVATEFDLGGITPGARSLLMAAGPDGNMWFTEFNANRIGRITPQGVVTEFSAGISPGAAPNGITAGPDGNLWFTENLGDRIGRITPAGVVTEFSVGISPGAEPREITAGADGNLWFTEGNGNRIGRITTSGVVTEFSAGISPGALPDSITAGSDGNVWFTENIGNRIGRITPAGVVTEFSAGISPGANITNITAGPGGNLWFTEFDGNRIGRITPLGVVTQFFAGITAGAAPTGITAGPDGNLWFTEFNGNRIARLTPGGVVTEFGAGIRANAGPAGIRTGPDGNLWFAEFFGDRIGRSTPLGVITELGGVATPLGITAGPDGNLWFTEIGGNQIGRITPLGVVTEFGAGISAGAAPVSIAAGSDGNLWFTEANANRIGRITPLGVVTEFSAGITLNAGLGGITAGPDGNLWFAEFTANRIGRITPLGVVTEFSAGITSGAGVSYITAGPDGNLWFAEGLGNRIGRITPLGVVTEFSAGISAGAGPYGITNGPDGNVWFTENAGDRIARITPTGVVTEFSAGISAFSSLRGITAGSDGNLWFTEQNGNRVGRITPLGVVTEFSAGITAGAAPVGIAAGSDGNLWFTEFNGNRIGRIATTSNLVVTNNNDSGSGSLRDAVAQANASPGPDTITFDPSVTGTITLTSGPLHISDGPLTIIGPGAGTLAVDGNALSPIFTIFEAVPACPAVSGPSDFLVSISGLTLQNGKDTGAGGAGGAIASFHSVALDSVVIKNSVAIAGGGVYIFAQYPGQALTITNSQFLGNIAKPPGPTPVATGGGFAIGDRCSGANTVTSTTIANSVFSGNSAQPTTGNGLGGAIGIFTPGTVAITDTRIINNTVIVPNPPVANQFYLGGGIIANPPNSLSILRSEISGNTAIDITDSGVAGGDAITAINRGSTRQGAADAMLLSIVDSTISGNTDPAFAGGVFVFGNVTATLDNSTMWGVTGAPVGTVGFLLYTGPTTPPTAANATTPTLAMSSSIVAGHSIDIGTDLATIPTFTLDADHSLIGTLCPSPTCEITVVGSGNLTAVDPMLGPLANNGGPTQTQALIVGSPAINAGSNPLSLTTDQRGTGFARVVGAAADMGAYEFNPAVAPVLQSAASRRTHGGAGPFNLPLTLTAVGVVNHNPTTEPRQGPLQNIVFTFDKPLNAATVTITAGTATAGAPTFSGNDVVVGLTGVTDHQYVTVTLTNVGSTDGGAGGSAEARIGFLVGDVNQTRVVSVADLGLVNAQLAQVVTAANYLKDVNASGTLTLADKGITNQNLTKALPAP